MELINLIRRDQSRRKIKRPLRITSYLAVSAIANRYGLSEKFLEKLDNVPQAPTGLGFVGGPIKEKQRLEAVPFPLSDSGQYRIARQIAKAAENPYLAYAKSPDEILLSKYLYAINPWIQAELLRSRHFEALILSESAKSRLKAISAFFEQLQPAENLPTKASLKKRLSGKTKEGPAKGNRTIAPEGPAIDALNSRMKALREFIDFVEDTNGSKGGIWPEK